MISSARLAPTSFAAAGKGGSLTRSRSTGTNISYHDSLAATNTFAVLRSATGHKSGPCCRSRPKRGQRRCTVTLTLGTFSHRDRAGNNRVHFTGRLRGRKLAPGRYALSRTPKAAGVLGRSVHLAFRVRA